MRRRRSSAAAGTAAARLYVLLLLVPGQHLCGEGIRQAFPLLRTSLGGGRWQACYRRHGRHSSMAGGRGAMMQAAAAMGQIAGGAAVGRLGGQLRRHRLAGGG